MAALTLRQRGPLCGVGGRALAANLPQGIPDRMAAHASALLRAEGIDASIAAERTEAACAGAGIFLTARYAALPCGFNAIGVRGKPAETVAAEAVEALLAHRRSDAALERHLADQILLPLCFAAGPSCFTVERITGHLKTNSRILGQFEVATVAADQQDNGTGLITVTPRGHLF